MEAVEVLVHAFDPLGLAGVKAILGRSPQLRVRLDADEPTQAPDVVVLTVEGVAGMETFAYLRRLHTRFAPGTQLRCVVVCSEFRSEDMLTAVECGVVGFLPRYDVTNAALVTAVLAVSRGAAFLPGSLQGVLLDQLAQLRAQVLEPEGLTLSGLENREREVLRLIADGYQTEEIAELLPYSEGTIKNVLYGFMARLGLTSRAHAVAYAFRTGAI
ncbi:response regulator transcription factor [Amycolatopsis sp. WQ 127309]|uniref:response regulator transcription factor n=1 Tax=Amycolatopsis sp. WQ 127309 TaxID=2932773 RepID=UPI001FF496DB|nr:response regulator transcription factor [Amycolatopsis sp. WQ 127309]UOZ06951.1 response regulator transcription factor [Amycolatopsis sp. WQ 127309]